MLTFLRDIESNKHKKKQAIYTCDCGNESIYIKTVVKNKRREHCKECTSKIVGERKRLDIKGRTFGFWTVLSYSKTINRQSFWLCRCECNKEHIVSGSSLVQEKSTKCHSCAVISSSKNRSHLKDGNSDNHRIYRIWKNMKQRCYGSYNSKNYKDKKVTICKEWRNDFLEFYKWSLTSGYNDSLEIDKDMICDELRISPKIYSPKTCIWINKKINTRYSGLKDLVEKEELRKEVLSANSNI